MPSSIQITKHEKRILLLHECLTINATTEISGGKRTRKKRKQKAEKRKRYEERNQRGKKVS